MNNNLFLKWHSITGKKLNKFYINLAYKLVYVSFGNALMVSVFTNEEFRFLDNMCEKKYIIYNLNSLIFLDKKFWDICCDIVFEYYTRDKNNVLEGLNYLENINK